MHPRTLLLLLALTAVTSALDTVTVQTIQNANEYGLVHGVVVFSRTGSSDPNPLVVNYDLSGTAVFGGGGDFTAPVVSGTVTFPPGQSTVSLDIVPRDNGAGGAKVVRVAVSPSGGGSGSYSVGGSNLADVIIADADVTASNSLTIQTARPTPSIITTGFPLEVLGRGVAHVSLSDYAAPLFRGVSVLVGSDPAIGPAAVLDTDCILAIDDTDLAGTAGRVTTIVPKAVGAAAPHPGDTSVGVASYNGFEVGDVFMFQAPADIDNGIYIISALTPAAAGTPDLVTFAPAIRTTYTIHNTTQIRRLGRHIPVGTTRDDAWGFIGDLYYTAYPLRTNVPRGRRSVNVNLIQSSDYRTLTPTSSTITVADDAVVTGLELGANAGQPNTTGTVSVKLSAPLPVEVDVPYSVSSSGATFGTDYTISGVVSGLGSIHIPANTTTATISIVPLGAALTLPGTVTLTLLPSSDYLLAPLSTSSVNPTADVTIAPALRTSNNEVVYLSIARVQDGFEGNTVTPLANAQYRVSLTNASGVPLTGTLASDLSFTYTRSGSAVAGTNYTAPSGVGVITAGTANSVITVLALNDGVVGSDATLQMTLGTGTGYQLASGSSSATAKIIDSSPSFTVAAGTNPVVGGATGTFVISNSNPTGSPVTVQLAAGGTGVADTDYTALPSSVLFPPNITSVTVSVVGATAGKTVSLQLQPDSASPATYKLGTTTAATLTIAASGSSGTAGGSKPPPSGAGGSSGCGAGGVALILGAGMVGLGLRRRRR